MNIQRDTLEGVDASYLQRINPRENDNRQPKLFHDRLHQFGFCSRNASDPSKNEWIISRAKALK